MNDPISNEVIKTSVALTEDISMRPGSSAGNTRVAMYTAAFCTALVIVFAWLTSYYVIGLEIRLNESIAATAMQQDKRLSSLEAIVKPKPEGPRYVEYKAPKDAPRLGRPEAKVEITEFADFQCPFCGKFFAAVLPQIKTDYIDTGKASFVYQDFAFLGKESVRAAEAAKCAEDQGKFWEYHDYLYTHQNGENQGQFKDANLNKFAAAIKLNPTAFRTCLSSGQHKAAVDAETESGKQLGVTGTPSFVVGKRFLVGALPYEKFKEAIEEALSK